MRRRTLLALLSTLGAGCLGYRPREGSDATAEAGTPHSTIPATRTSTAADKERSLKPAGLQTPAADTCTPARPSPDSGGPAEPTPYPERPAALSEQQVRSYLVDFEAAWRANQKLKQWEGTAHVSYDVWDHRVSLQSQGNRYVAEVYLEGAYVFRPIETSATGTTSVSTETKARPTATTTPIPSSPNSGTANYYLSREGLVRFIRNWREILRQRVVACY